MPLIEPGPRNPEERQVERRLSIIGTGYVGLVTALAFARHGHHVTCVDVVPERVDLVARGEPPFYEPGVGEALSKHVAAGLVKATGDTAAAVEATEATFICVGTPSAPDGSYDLSQVEAAARAVGRAVGELDRHHVVVTKSTLSPTANRQGVLPVLCATSGRMAPGDFSLASNPEFLREGSALHDAFEPDRVVIGLMEGDTTARDLLVDMYRPLGRPILVTSLEGAELIKLASNSLLAIKVAFANEVANIAAAVGADGYEVLEGVGLDHRLGPHFLRAGAGFGGSCFPKDLRALVAFSETLEMPALMPGAALEQNDVQPVRVVSMVRAALGELRGRRVTLLGLAFKPDTDDVRETRALPILEGLLVAGATVVCHDPRASRNFLALAHEVGLEGFEIEHDLDSALRGAEAVVIQTEWEEYKRLEPANLVELCAHPPTVVDARRTLDPDLMVRGGVTYHGMGYPGH